MCIQMVHDGTSSTDASHLESRRLKAPAVSLLGERLRSLQQLLQEQLAGLAAHVPRQPQGFHAVRVVGRLHEDVLVSYKRKGHLYSIVLPYIILYCIVLYCIVLFCIVLYCIVLYCSVFYSILLYYIILCYIIFYYIEIIFIFISDILTIIISYCNCIIVYLILHSRILHTI